jgi:Ca2+-binding RTX toxin-like protein
LPSIAALPGGGFVVTWSSPDAESGFPICYRARVFSAQGTASDDFVVNTTTNDFQGFHPSIALADGRFMVTWESSDITNSPGDSLDGDGTCIRGRVFNADGTAVGNDFIVNSTTEGDQEEPSVTALADGRFVVMWDSHDSAEGVGNSDCARARIINADGTFDGADFIINTTPGGSQDNPHAVALADGRFVAVWDSGDGQEVSSTFAVRGQVFDPKIFTGTIGDDVWKGGNLADQITGDIGADILSGLGGNDSISGDTGTDTLTGGFGQDLLTGGADHDIFNFDFKAETSKGASRDVITDFQHGVDDIDLRDFDAKKGIDGNQKFHWIGGANFHHLKGELHFDKVNEPGTANDKTIVEGDTDGDGRADFQISLTGLIHLTKGDFVL